MFTSRAVIYQKLNIARFTSDSLSSVLQLCLPLRSINLIEDETFRYLTVPRLTKVSALDIVSMQAFHFIGNSVYIWRTVIYWKLYMTEAFPDSGVLLYMYLSFQDVINLAKDKTLKLTYSWTLLSGHFEN